ncbi:hypothetical protein JTB14_008074 [Gonioctena quinquepunctata]|nr:hypothetical protein JTB14_008074 [Gonioctena quinquepunctata]
MHDNFKGGVLIVLIYIYLGFNEFHIVSGTTFLNELPGNLTRLKRQYEGFKCTLPSYPDNGRWVVVHGEGRPGEKVDYDTGLKFICHPGYKLSPKHPYILCDTNWDPKSMPKCLKLCQPLYSTPTTILKCKDVSDNAISCSEATDGTYLTYECIPYYEALGRKLSLYCSGGFWDSSKPVCQPVCGRKVDKEVAALVYGGEDTGKYEYPWIAAIYIKDNGEYINKCGGTLISPRVVITAAHCVTNGYGNAFSEDLIEIGTGKYFNKYGDPRDIHAQYSKAARVTAHGEFRALTRRYQYDIALIITKKIFTLGEVVQPACFNNLNIIYPRVGSIGELAGWGTTEQGEASDTLRTIRIPYKEQTSCNQELPSGWSDRYSLDDKICAGFHSQNKSVCHGDSGSGLVFRNPEDNRFYVHGIVSIAPKMTNVICNYQDNTLYTRVSHYYEWLDKKITTNYVEDCILPPLPRNGKWQLENGEERLPGDRVPSTSVLVYSCRQGYKLSTVNSKFYCGPSLEPPSCDVSCPPLNSSPTTTLKCIYCSGGSWNFPIPVCKPVCGKKVDNEVSTIVSDGKDIGKYEYPWITAIYRKTHGEFINSCVGTLITPRIIVTGAHCLTESNENVISEELIAIGVGKYFNKYEDTRDIYAQYSKAARVILHEAFKGDIRRYQYDIALVITKRMFTLSPFVQPACYNNIDTIYPNVGSVGELAGWGLNEDGKPSDTLKTIKIPYKEQTTCTQELPSEWSNKYNFEDKMCADL